MEDQDSENEKCTTPPRNATQQEPRMPGNYHPAYKQDARAVDGEELGQKQGSPWSLCIHQDQGDENSDDEKYDEWYGENGNAVESDKNEKMCVVNEKREDGQDALGTMSQDTLKTFETLKLSATQALYSISQALRFNRLKNLFQKCEIRLDTPLYLVGQRYSPAVKQELEQNSTTDASTLNARVDSMTLSPTNDVGNQMMSQFALQFRSLPYMTYRRGFQAIVTPSGESLGLTSDAGWGCTLRVAQMMAALALQRVIIGPDWRCSLEESQSYDTDMVMILELFRDTEDSPLSIHNICKHGSTYGICPGRWAGPSMAAKAMSAALNAAHLPITAFVLSGGGGAPVLYTQSKIDDVFICNKDDEEERGLLLLIPLVMGVDKINPVYIPQVHAMLETHQSVGIIGGSSQSSFFLVGHQGTNIFYLDPHEVQSATWNGSSWKSYQCDIIKSLSSSSIDSSAAFGFVCRSHDEYRDLLKSFENIEALYPSCPIVCVREGPVGACDDTLDMNWAFTSEDDDDLLQSDHNDSDPSSSFFVVGRSDSDIL